MSEIICVEVTRKQVTEVFIRVPTGWDAHEGVTKAMLVDACKTTVPESDWVLENWESTLQVVRAGKVPESVVEEVPVFVVE